MEKDFTEDTKLAGRGSFVKLFSVISVTSFVHPVVKNKVTEMHGERFNGGYKAGFPDLPGIANFQR